MSTLPLERRLTGMTRTRFVLAIFAGSFLLFLVQPMVARMALPRLGGAPAVWNSAMLVYQALLLGGYAYAHLLRRLNLAGQVRAQILLMAVASLTLPIGLLADQPPSDANPLIWVPWLFLKSIGPLFLVISAQAPLLQKWFTLSGGKDPYPLYAASNLGSFSGLLCYPLLLEPNLGITDQSLIWSLGFGTLILLVLWCGLAATPARTAAAEVSSGASGWPPMLDVLRWIMIAAVPSGLILSTTLHLTTDIVAMPLLWVIPLGVYLLSFSVAFAENRKIASLISDTAPFLLLLSVLTALAVLNTAAAILAILSLFSIGVALHSRLFDLRPPPQQLTHFYLALAIGGVVGGIFCALLAPLIFDSTYEHPILLVGSALLLVRPSPLSVSAEIWNGSARARMLTRLGLIAVAVLAVSSIWLDGLAKTLVTLPLLLIGIFAVGHRILFGACIAGLILSAGGWDRLGRTITPGQMTRSYFGVYSISGSADMRSLTHGTTVHGLQLLGSAERRRTATSYYARRSGVGLALAATPRIFGPSARVSVVGLGAGTLACYARPGQSWTFYEIDPVVEKIARDPRLFTFLSDCLPEARIVIGDARITLADAPAANTDILVVDAFSSDSIPMHLLTAEAFEDYRRVLAPDGMILIHITNRHLDLKPVLAGLTRGGRWHALTRTSESKKGQRDFEFGTEWVALSPTLGNLAALAQANPGAWLPLRSDNPILWTDEHASLLPILKW